MHLGELLDYVKAQRDPLCGGGGTKAISSGTLCGETTSVFVLWGHEGKLKLAL